MSTEARVELLEARLAIVESRLTELERARRQHLMPRPDVDADDLTGPAGPVRSPVTTSVYSKYGDMSVHSTVL